jgi:uncharacterized protein (TIGR00297 family)
VGQYTPPPGGPLVAVPRGAAVRLTGVASELGRWAGACLMAGTIAGAARRARALTATGAVAATATGAMVMARGGLPAAAALVVFFVTSSALSRFKARAKARRGVIVQAKGGERDARQVLANGGVAAACLALAGVRGSGGFLGALGAAGADTWATELGLLATHPPRLLTTWRPVAPGTSGGVTLQGSLAGAAGAVAVGAAWTLVQGWRTRAWESVGGAVAVAGVAGTLGAFVDSALGATVQAGYRCPACGQAVETPVHAPCGRPAILVRGWPWVDNDVVNALATTAGALAGMVLGRHLLRPLPASRPG